jgi:hypothetical protein
LDAALPYYVASRALRDLQQFRQVAAGFVLAAVIVAVLAVFESGRFWLLYESLRAPLDVPAHLATYLQRGEGGPLRANVSLGNSIVLGYVLMLALSMFLFLAPILRPAWKRHVAGLCLLAGLIASWSRGPWVGAAVVVLTTSAIGPRLGKRLAWAAAAGAVLLPVLVLSPLGDAVVGYLPFVGRVESNTIDYRQRLFEVSAMVFIQNPIIGDFRYLDNPLMAQMRQGQGIIDMVNTYAQIALPSGLVGLLLFAGVFASALRSVWRVRQRIGANEPELERLGRTLFAGLLGILLTIATVSSIGAIPTLYWLMVGLCASYVRVCGAYEAGRRDPTIVARGRIVRPPSSARPARAE